MSKRTATEWLALPEPERGVALAKVLTPTNTKHKFGEVFVCRKGRLKKCQHCMKNFPAHTKQNKCVPDPIVIDWNTAKYWQGKCDRLALEDTMWSVYWASGENNADRAYLWWRDYAQPYHYLVAAAMAQDK